MLERRRGHIVNMASVAGKGGGPFMVTYSATKAGLVIASRALRAELAGTGVKVSAVCQGFVEQEGMYARQVEAVGMRASRWRGTTTPEKVATAVVRSIREDAPSWWSRRDLSGCWSRSESFFPPSTRP
jgi:short-subunit dehydrogenase